MAERPRHVRILTDTELALVEALQTCRQEGAGALLVAGADDRTVEGVQRLRALIYALIERGFHPTLPDYSPGASRTVRLEMHKGAAIVTIDNPTRLAWEIRPPDLDSADEQETRNAYRHEEPAATPVP